MQIKGFHTVRIAATLARWQNARHMSGHARPANWKSDKEIAMMVGSHMNFMPVPEGSWLEDYKRKNAKGNRHLAISSLLFSITVFIMYKTGCLYMHLTPPLVNKKE